MAYEQNRNALCLQLQDDFKKRGNFFFCQGCSRLVHNNQLGVEHQSAANGNHLLLGNGKRPHQAVELHFKIDFCQCFFCDLAHTFSVDQLMAGCKLRVESQVLHDGQIREN